jgi:RNase H-like domain found in reverse transcriptase
VKFKWIPRCEQAFNDLKRRFITTPILAYFNPDLKYVVKTDSSDYVLGGVLSQYNKNGELRLVAFLFRKLASIELNYKIYNKELLAIIRCFK